MKIRNFFACAAAALAMLMGCQPQEDNPGVQDIYIDRDEMIFEETGGQQELTVTATCDWKVESDADWVEVSPESGAGSLEPQKVTVTTLENTGKDRSVDLKFTIGQKSKYLTVSQAGPSGGSTMTIAEVLASSGALASGSTIEGVVISNMDLNNLTSKKGMYIQDETAGVQFYLAANHTFAFGDKVQIDLSGVSVGEYMGAVQISGLSLDKITKISSGNTVTPKVVSIDDFLANKYEGQYIAIEGVQVTYADLSKTFVMGAAHTSIGMEDANGNKFVVFSSKYATYGTQAVPQGSGTIKGISSINNGNMQIIFAQSSDFAGLTGTRFNDPDPGQGGGSDEGNGDALGNVDITATGWLELPAMDNPNLEYYAHRFKMDGNIYRNYSFGWSQKDRVALWVAYPLCRLYTSGSVGRTDAWALDPFLGSDSAAPFSGYAGDYARGHQLPSADRQCCYEANAQTFYGTNMTPQLNEHNEGIWANLENKVRGYANTSDTTYVVTGVMVSATSEIQKDSYDKNVTVPDAYFKAVLKYSPSSAHGTWNAIAFYLEHRAYSGSVGKEHSMSIDELEEMTGLDFFVNLPAKVGETQAAEIESTDPATSSVWW